MITTDQTHTHYGTGSSQPQTKQRESKLKTILLGTPEQREARKEELEEELYDGKKDKGLAVFFARMIFEPGYALRHAIYQNNLGLALIGGINLGLLAGTTYVASELLGRITQ